MEFEMIENFENYSFLTNGVVSYTGHRPKDLLGGYIDPIPFSNACGHLLENLLSKIQPKIGYTGMAQGFDQIAAKVHIKMQIPFVACVPLDNFDIKWPLEARKTYNKILSKAKEIVVVSSNQPYHPKLLQIRNEYMVDKLQKENDYLIALWSGKRNGGTWNCLEYAQNLNKNIIRISPDDIKI